jgi:hypothetical protein
MQNIQELFTEGDMEISIIGNKLLNAQLSAIAEVQFTRIATANKSVEVGIKNLFFGRNSEEWTCNDAKPSFIDKL